LVEPLPRLDVAAFLEFTLEHDAVDASAHLRNQVRGGTARQLGNDRHG